MAQSPEWYTVNSQIHPDFAESLWGDKTKKRLDILQERGYAMAKENKKCPQSQTTKKMQIHRHLNTTTHEKS